MIKTEEVLVRVMPKHIRKATPMARYDCPVAKAIGVHLNTASRCYVSSAEVVFNKFPTKGPSYTINLPTQVTEFIEKMDRQPTAPPSPIQFRVNVPTKSLK